ncbi:MAG: hypothetical protein KKI02_03615, partial [Planctomycetes bacterium]|nr:hypothetical protein [Planctomycetota bacterium]
QTRNACNEFGYESVALVPIRPGDRVLGLIHVADPRENMVALTTVELLEKAAMQLGAAIERVAAEEAARSAQELLLEQQRHETECAAVKLDKLRELLVRQTRLATIGQISASIAHELRNPLGTVRNAAYYLKHHVPGGDPKLVEHLGIIEQETAVADGIISNLVEITRAREPIRQAADLGQIVREVLDRADLPEEIRCHVSLDPDPFVLDLDPGQLRQVLANLLTNAVQAMEGRGEIRVAGSRSADYDTVVFGDTGPGVASEVRALLFEPLVTTKAKGIGLGLTICRQIVERHGGTIELVDDNQRGAAFRVRLPR